jgi:hypothetical protein
MGGSARTTLQLQITNLQVTNLNFKMLGEVKVKLVSTMRLKFKIRIKTVLEDSAIFLNQV